MDSLASVRLLIVEDEALIASELQDRLQAMGATIVGIVDTAEQAIECAGRERPDLVLMDIRLKGRRDGIDAATEIYARLNIPSLFLTAYSDRATLERVVSIGQFGYLTKPFREGDLSTAIQLALHHSRLEAGLRESQLSLRQILGNAAEGLIAVDRHQNVRYVNSAAEALLAINAGQVLEKDIGLIGDLRHEQTGAALTGFVAATLAGRAEALRDQPFVLTHADGGRAPIEVSLTAIPDGDRIIGAAISLRSLIERRRSEAERERNERALQNQRALLGTLIDGLPELFFAVDRNERIAVANRALLETLGRKRHEVVDRSLLEVFSGDDLVDICGQARTAIRTGNRITFQRRAWTNLDGTLRWFSFSYIPLSGDGDIVLACTAVDVTERRQLEDELIEATSREQRRLSRDLHDTLGQELARLGMVIGRVERKFARTIPEMLPELAEIKEIVDSAFEAIRATARGLAPTELHNGGLVAALRNLAATFRRGRGPECEFICTAEELPSIEHGVAEQMFRFAQEATSNAARHANAQVITIKLEAAGSLLELSVSDDGVGIEATRTKTSGGFGLRIMEYRAHSIGGIVRFEQPPVGTRIVLRVPLSALAAAADGGADVASRPQPSPAPLLG